MSETGEGLSTLRYMGTGRSAYGGPDLTSPPPHPGDVPVVLHVTTFKAMMDAGMFPQFGGVDISDWTGDAEEFDAVRFDVDAQGMRWIERLRRECSAPRSASHDRVIARWLVASRAQARAMAELAGGSRRRLLPPSPPRTPPTAIRRLPSP